MLISFCVSFCWHYTHIHMILDWYDTSVFFSCLSFSQHETLIMTVDMFRYRHRAADSDSSGLICCLLLSEWLVGSHASVFLFERGRVSAIHSCENLWGLLEVSVSPSNSHCSSTGLSYTSPPLDTVSTFPHINTVSREIYFIFVQY